MIADEMRALTNKTNENLIKEARNSDRYKYLFTNILESAKRGEDSIFFTLENNDKYCIQVFESEGFTVSYSKLGFFGGGELVTRVQIKW